ncbi:MAG: AIM24 family protein [Actinomycetota bacterium]|nr:AIM24 family protein [Actinomycetota bacterium]
MTIADTGYVCRYCRQPSDPSGVSCPRCGAPIDVTAIVSRSGWMKQPPIKDMARIQFGQSHVQIEGRQVPTADFALAPGDSIYFGHHTMLWLDPATRLQAMSMAGGWKRMIAGLPVIMTQASGPGHIALSDDHAGEIVALPLNVGQQIWVREHRFLAASGNLTYGFEANNIWIQTGSGNDAKTTYPLGWIGDRFSAQNNAALLLLHAPGNTFVRDLAAGESILIQPTALLYRDLSVQAQLHIEYPRTQGFFSMFNRFSYRHVWLRLSGPGRVAMQSVFEREEESEMITGISAATEHRW